MNNVLLKELIERYPALKICEKDILSSLDILISCFESNRKLFVAGNGGSAADSLHIVGELMKSFKCKRPIDFDLKTRLMREFPDDADYLTRHLEKALPVHSLVSEAALLTAYVNDQVADLVYAQQIVGYGCTGDVLLLLSTSGCSKNILYAAKVARIKGLKVVSLSGSTGGYLKDLSDVCICVPEEETYKIQELHLPVYHYICAALENYFMR